MVAYPSYFLPTTQESPLFDLQRGFESGRTLRQEHDAPKAFDAYLDSLLGARRQQVASLTDVAPPSAGNPLFNGTQNAVAGAQATPGAQALAGALAAQGLRPGAEPGVDYLAAIRTAESGGNDAARNPRSSATGRYQFLEGTWNDLMRQHPELGLTPDGRTDPEQQERAIRVFTGQNAKALQAAGINPEPGALYAAHFLGAGGATKVLGGNPGDPVSAYVDPGVIQANPHLQGMSVADFQQWAASKGGNGKGGFSAPQAGGAPQQTAQAGAGLPPREVMSELFKNPHTRPIAIELVKAAQSGVAPKPVEINGQLVDPTTGKVIGDYRDPAQPDAGPSSVQEYQFYAEQEKAAGRQPVSIVEYAQLKKGGGLQVVTNPDGTVSITQGGPGGMPKLTEGQGKDVVYLTRAAGALPALDQHELALTSFGEFAADKAPLGLGNYLQSEGYQQAKQAGLEFLAAVLRKDTGAAVTPSEEDMYGRMFLPRPGDKPATLEQKRTARARALKAMELGMPPAAVLALVESGVDLPDVDGSGAPNEAPAASDAPPPSFTADPSLWDYMTPEERALWN